MDVSVRESEEDVQDGIEDDSKVLRGIVLPFTEVRRNKFREKIKELIFENAF